MLYTRQRKTVTRQEPRLPSLDASAAATGLTFAYAGDSGLKRESHLVARRDLHSKCF